jgi:hypothetical protein
MIVVAWLSRERREMKKEDGGAKEKGGMQSNAHMEAS